MSIEEAYYIAEQYLSRVRQARYLDDRYGGNREEAVHAEYRNLPREVIDALNDIAI